MTGSVLRGVLVTFGVASAMPVAAEEAVRTDSFGRWAVNCEVETADGQADKVRECVLFHRVMVEEAEPEQVVLSLVVGGATKAEQLIFVAPLGLNLPAGLRVSVDGKDAGALAFATCDPTGCKAVVPLASDWETRFRRGGEGVVEVGLVDGRKMSIPFLLDGFSKGLEFLRARSSEITGG